MPNHPSVGPFAADASIHLIASDVLDACVDDVLPPALLSVIPSEGGFDLGLRPLGDSHPSELLVGFSAPADWYSIGIAARGWAYPVGERASPDRNRSRVHLVSFVSRSGEMAHVVRTDDPDHPLNTTNEAPSGEQIDLLCRSLGLATPPPPCGSTVFWAIEWLSALLDADCEAMQTWAEVTDWHPAARITAASDIAALLPDLDLDGQVIAAQFAFSRVLTWERIRDIAAIGAFGLPGITSSDAEWFDDGSLARYVLNRCPPLSFLRSQATATLRPDLARKLEETLSATGVGGPVWPDVAPDTAA